MTDHLLETGGLGGRGRTNREIASLLHLGEKTVENYVGTSLSKPRVQRRTAALDAKQKLS